MTRWAIFCLLVWWLKTRILCLSFKDKRDWDDFGIFNSAELSIENLEPSQGEQMYLLAKAQQMWPIKGSVSQEFRILQTS